MAQAILNFISKSGPSVYYTEAYQNMIEDHLLYLKKDGNYNLANVDVKVAQIAHLDLFHYLALMAVPNYLHWTIMRLNDMVSPTEFTYNTAFLYVPSESVLSTLISAHQAAEKKKT